MSKSYDGGPAFPADSYATGDGGRRPVIYSGMTLRDYFAAKAMSSVPVQSAYNMKDNESHERYVARRAYAMADAMLKARQA